MNYATYRVLLDACVECKTKEEADEVLRKAKEDNPVGAESNIGYLFGYLDRTEAERLYALFPTCNHPIFGPRFGRGYEAIPKEAFETGQKLGQQLKEKKEGAKK